MKPNIISRIGALFSSLLLLLTACEHPDLSEAVPNENIRPTADFINNNFEMTLFSAAVKKLGMTDELNGEGAFTVLVPNDAAFNEVGVMRPSDFDKLDQDSLERIIRYHIIPRRLVLSDIPTNGVDIRYKTLEGSELHASVGSFNRDYPNPVNHLYFDGSYAVRKDVITTNGVVYVLQKLMKPKFEVDIQRWLSSQSQYSVFVKGLQKFGLWSQLAGNSVFTVFAPTNEALAQIGITDVSLDEMSVTKYDADLLFGVYLIYNKHFFISDSRVLNVINSTGVYNYTLQNHEHYMRFSAVEKFGGGLNYNLVLRRSVADFGWPLFDVTYLVEAKMDNLCSNGVVHELDKGLMRPDQSLTNNDQ